MSADALALFERAFLPLAAPRVSLPSFTGGAAAYAAAALARNPVGGAPLVFALAPGLPEADALAEDLRIVAAPAGVRVLEFPPELEGDASALGLRVRAVAALGAYALAPAPLVIVTSPPALLKGVPSPDAVSAASVHLGGADGVGLSAAAAALAAAGYAREGEVLEPGVFAVRGCVLDAWAPGEELPVRAEFFGEELESLRRFDPAAQTSVAETDHAEFPPVGSSGARALVPFVDLVPDDATALYLDYAGYESQLPSRPFARVVYTGDPAPRGVPSGDFVSAPLPGFAESGAEIARNPELVAAVKSQLRDHLARARARGSAVVSADDLSGGFECPGLVVVAKADVEFAHRRRVRRNAPAAGRRAISAPELEPGELVVHLDYGIGRFQGTTEIESDGRRVEVITVEYADGALLHVPVTQAHLLSRYVGVKGAQVKLHRLDGRRWTKDKVAAQRSVQDLAASLLQMQARRAVSPGFAYDVACDGIEAFEAGFPYEETEDQAKAIAEVKRDLASVKPMDRLLCGDAGYGKTEVAMRAAFIVAMNGRQVALLAPTTVLAEQHFETFLRRFADTPVRVEALSRFQSAESRAGALARLAAGTADIVVGTHALLGGGVRFHDLGLVVIDEEQRFGVKHKEHLKSIRATADVLAMSATPIPRTLYMSMTGARDLSLLRTPPHERVAVETRVMRDSDQAVAAAIRHELARGGQVYFLHNRVLTIDIVERRLRSLVPEARIEVAHGQMPAAELAAAMRRFQQGRVDVLLCTTIVESGLDIPRANTILVDRADRFGIADLYQLRGRVGRSSRQGHAFFLLPAEGAVDADARERLAALRKHAGLGAGFNLAVRDLELRGAGNLLGPEQSGHIAAIGFGLYCQLLQRTIAMMKGEEVPLLVSVTLDLDFLDYSPGAPDGPAAACLPYDYVEDEAQRMGFHKRLAEASAARTVRRLRDELKDRYGKMPPAVVRLLKLAELRVRCAEKGIIRVEVRGDRVVFHCDESRIPTEVLHLPAAAKSPSRKLAALFRLVDTSTFAAHT